MRSPRAIRRKVALSFTKQIYLTAKSNNFAPSAKGLQQLLDICSKFALSHNVVFNVVKSQCLIVSSRSDFIRRPTFQLSGASLPYTECYKYLGHMINSALSDDQDITKQTRSLYARANVIIRKFSHASLNTKHAVDNFKNCQKILSVYKNAV